PMVNCLEDVDAALVLIKQARNELVQEGVALGTIPIGVMIEVPEALYQLEALARRVDFLSIGSNDLTQYLLAVDRNNDRVERWYRPFHPAVLQAIHSIAKAGQKYGLSVSICGEVAGNPAMVILLLGMGIDTLSLSAGDLSRVKMTVRALNLAQAQSILKQALTLEKTDAIESMLERELIALGLGGLIRPGSC
ncbi:MAG: phosphotransferase system enzyme I (PtsP), partial [Lentisphaeria bacterium]